MFSIKRFVSLTVALLFFIVIAIPTQAAEVFSVDYYNNTTLSGTPAYSTTESTIDHSWGTNGPGSGVNAGQFSARWTGTFTFEEAAYDFTMTIDDGGKLIVDGNTVINQWKDQGPTTYHGIVDMAAGEHVIVMEYYEGGGGATAQLHWEKATTPSPDAQKIMPLGDSITDGWNVPGGYRTDLKSLVPDSDFVGSQNNGPAILTDREHEGHPGWKIHDLQGFMTQWLDAQHPEMVLLMIGTNDVLSDHQLSTAPDRLSTLLDTIAQHSPNTDVLVATIIPIDNVTDQQQADAYNATIPGMVQQKRDAGKKVHFVDMASIAVSDLADGVHPSEAGYAKIAQVWANAITTVRGSATPPIPDETITPDPVPTPTPTPEDPGTGAFSASYYNNTTTSGIPALVRNEATINNEWGSAAPAPGVNTDNFSVVWTTTQTFAPGTYELMTTADDGVRLYVDDELVLDQWKDQGPTTYTVSTPLSGEHTIKMKYYEHTGGATAKLSWQLVAPYPTPTPDPTPTPTVTPATIPLDNGFAASYFNNMTLAGNPVLQRLEQEVDNEWGNGSPGSGVNSDFFSARWTGDVTFAPGTYRFTVRADDGVRLKIDNNTVINQWKDQGPTTYTADVSLSDVSRIVMEYYENGGGATAQMSWALVQSGTNPPTQPGSAPAGQYLAQYYNNMTLAGSPAYSSIEADVNHDWGLGSPDASVNTDHFSARWSKTQEFNAGTYRFTVRADDGVRLKVDGKTIIDKWIDQAPTTYSVDLTLAQGDHAIVMEYYENGWGAVAQLDVQSVTPPPVVEQPTDGSYLMEFFNNMTLTGLPVYSTTTPTVNYEWGLGSVNSSVQDDFFSARATRTKTYTAGTHRFTLTADDGVRMKIDGVLVFDKWIDQAPTTYHLDVPLSAGEHTVVVEYYEKQWGAVLQLGETQL